MAMVRQSIRMEEPVRTTTKILNLYNKSADPGNKTGSLVLTTTIPNGGGLGSEVEPADFDASEITVIFEDEIETLYVGPVEISEEEQQQQHQRMQQLEEAAQALAAEQEAVIPAKTVLVATREKESNSIVVVGGGGAVGGGGRGAVASRKAPARILNSSPPTKHVTGTSPVAQKTNKGKLSSSPVAESKATTISNGNSDSGIDNCSRADDNKKKNIAKSSSPAVSSKDLKQSAVKKATKQQTLTEMVIKKRGRPPGSKSNVQVVEKVAQKSSSEVQRATAKPATTTTEAVTPIRKVEPVTTMMATTKVSPRPQYECELCDEIFSREDTIVDHYQSYHRVDPKKRTIQPRVNIPKAEPDIVPECEVPQTVAQEVIIEVSTTTTEPSVSPLQQQKSSRFSASVETVKREKKNAPGLICGKCNLTFRTILLLSRHVKEMHDCKEEEEEDDDDDEEEEDGQDFSADEDEEYIPTKVEQKSLLKSRGKENHNDSGASSTAAGASGTPSGLAVKKPRGRPRKSEAVTPRILNAEKGLVRVRMPKTEDESGDDEAASAEEEVPEEKPRRGRKRKASSFAENDHENEVVPKRASKRNPPTTTTIKVKAAAGEEDQDSYYVEVIDEKLEEDVAANVSTLNGSATMVYKIKDAGTVDKDGKTKFACPLCDLTFTRRYSLEPHIQRVHQKLRPKECQYCDRKFLATGDLTRHLAIHTNSKPYECSIQGCSYRFVSRSDLMKHELRHTACVPRTYVCGSCDKSFERPYDLRRHQTTHKDMQVDFRVFKCDQCDREFVRKDEYRAHMYRHLGVKPLKCHVCGKPFTDNSNCAKHCKSHGPPQFTNEDPLECNQCYERFTNPSALSRHVVRCLYDRSSLPVHSVPQWVYFEEDVK